MKRVVAGLIVRDGKLLVCQRTRHQTMPLKWSSLAERSKKESSPALHFGGNWKKNWNPRHRR